MHTVKIFLILTTIFLGNSKAIPKNCYLLNRQFFTIDDQHPAYPSFYAEDPRYLINLRRPTGSINSLQNIHNGFQSNIQYGRPFWINFYPNDEQIKRTYNQNFYQQDMLSNLFLNVPQFSRFSHSSDILQPPPAINLHLPRTIMAPHFFAPYKPLKIYREKNLMNPLINYPAHTENIFRTFFPNAEILNQVESPATRIISDNSIENVNKNDKSTTNPITLSSNNDETSLKSEIYPNNDEVATRILNDELENSNKTTTITNLEKAIDLESRTTARIFIDDTNRKIISSREAPGNFPDHGNVPLHNSESNITKNRSSTELPTEYLDSHDNKGQKPENELALRQNLNDIEVPEIITNKLDKLIDKVLDDVSNTTQKNLNAKKKCKNKEWLKKQIEKWLQENYESLLNNVEEEKQNGNQ